MTISVDRWSAKEWAREKLVVLEVPAAKLTSKKTSMKESWLQRKGELFWKTRDYSDSVIYVVSMCMYEVGILLEAPS